jgi:hypothetical protein
MFRKFYLTKDDTAICEVEFIGRFSYYSMADKYPFLINPAETLPGKACEVNEEEFMKYANPAAVKYLKGFFKNQ